MLRRLHNRLTFHTRWILCVAGEVPISSLARLSTRSLDPNPGAGVWASGREPGLGGDQGGRGEREKGRRGQEEGRVQEVATLTTLPILIRPSSVIRQEPPTFPSDIAFSETRLGDGLGSLQFDSSVNILPPPPVDTRCIESSQVHLSNITQPQMTIAAHIWSAYLYDIIRYPA